MLHFRTLWCLIIFTLSLLFLPSTIQAATPASVQYPKTIIISYDPIIESENNQRLHTVMGWNDPAVLAQEFITKIKSLSGNTVQYRIVETKIIDGYPLKTDGTRYTDEEYLSCVRSGTCADVQVDYANEIREFNLCAKRNNGRIGEVWFFAGPWLGLYESRLTGPGAFLYNGPPLEGTACEKQLPMMGFNPERTVTEMLHSYSHRVEAALYETYKAKPFRENMWTRFTWISAAAPNGSGCGTVHFAPNAYSQYEYNNTTRTIASLCDSWYNYPNLSSSTVKYINCSAWGCNESGYIQWWLSHIPRFQGKKNGVLNNWWAYVLDYPAAVKLAAN